MAFYRNRAVLPLLFAVCLIAEPISLGMGQGAVAQTPTQQVLTPEQTAALQKAKALDQQITQLYQAGKYSEALLLAEQALVLYEQIWGKDHPDVASVLHDLAGIYVEQGRYREAESFQQRALTIRTQSFGRVHPNVAESLNNLSGIYVEQGRYREAEVLLKEALSIDKSLGRERHQDFATSLHNLGRVYQFQASYTDAESLYQQALTLYKFLLGERSLNVATSLGALGTLYGEQSRHSEATSLHQEALAIRRDLLGDQHPAVALSLMNVAGAYQEEGRYAEAEPLYQRGLQIYETRLGKDHPAVARSLNNLAELYNIQGRYTEAESLYQRSLLTYEARLGKDHPAVARSLNDLALVYESRGRYAEAEPLYQRGLQIYEARLGKDHPAVARSLNNLAELYKRQGRYAEAEPIYQRSLQTLETRLGKDHPNVASSLNNLANLYQVQGRYTEAESLLQRSLQIFETRLGKKHPLVAASLNNLAVLYHVYERYGEAESLYQRGLQIYEARLGKDHPGIASILNGLAVLYRRQRRYQEAESLLQRSLQIDEIQGKNHPLVASSLINLSVLYQDQDKVEQAIAFLNQGIQIQERNLGINLVIGSEQQKREYIATIAGTADTTISLNLQAAPTNSDATRLALTTTLQRKGRILDVLTDNLNRLRQNLTPADQQKLDQLAAVRTQLATLYYGGLGDRAPEQYRAQITQLQQQATQLEAALNTRSAEFRTATQPIELAAVQAQIPADAVLIELVQYRPFNPKAKRDEQWGKPRYAAYTLTASGTIHAVDLGEAAPIDQLADDFRHALRNRESNVKPIARKLDAVLMQPIRAKLGNTRNLLLSPDSQLNLIPFAALVDEQNRYLVETYSINYLTSGRDLLRLQNPVASRQPPVLIANPDYANPGNPQAVAQLPTANPVAISASNSPRPGLGEGQGVRAANQRSSDLARLQFTPLPGTAAEADAIAPKLPNVTLLTGTNATENALKQVQSPKILHIATHGFFLEDVPPVAAGTRGAGFLLRSDILPNIESGFRPPARPGNTENALVRSGLALAGFNPRQSGAEDGVLTAIEAAGLDLRGTQLVVLSACETGVGDVANGEGVYGLRRAFVMAGAESQLISLWKVDDNGTKDLMVNYYDKLLAKTGRSDALRQTQLEFLTNPKYEKYKHPYYWAAFIPSGNWQPLAD